VTELTAVHVLEPDGDDVAAYQRAWVAARAAAARATRAWAAASGDALALAIADGADADSSAEALHPSFERVAALLLEGRIADDIGASNEQRLLRSTLRELATTRVAPHARAIHREDADIPDEVISAIADAGLFALSVPERYGGIRGAEDDAIPMLVGTEELSAASLAAGGSLMTRPEILIGALFAAGTEQQKQRWLPAIASGAQLVAVSVTEPNHGSDVASIQCRAARQPDGSWLVDGTKLWCTFAGRAHLLMLLCRTGGPGHRGLSLFVAEKPSSRGHEFEHRQPEGGRLAGRAIPTIGYRGMHTFELAFERYRIPADGLIGEEGRGFYLQLGSFAPGRLQTAARAVGVMHAAVRDTIAYTSQRRVFGRPIADHALARQLIGRMGVRLHASRQLAYAAARTAGPRGELDAALAKLYASRMAEYVTRDAMQLFGGMGYGEETDVSRYFVDARVLTIFEGAEEVLALRVIGRAAPPETPAAT
jgi:(2S)-methylsuccinyl-CoA dehydrogenase